MSNSGAISAESKPLFKQIKPYMEAEKLSLQQRHDKGERWPDRAADQKANELRSSANLALTQVFNAGINYGRIETINLDPAKDVRLAKLISHAIELKKNLGPGHDQEVFDGVMKEMRKQYGKYDDFLSQTSDKIAELEAKYDKSRDSKTRASLEEQITKLNADYKTHYNKRGHNKDGHYEIQNFAKDTLVCREYTAVASMALHYGGIENYYCIGTVTNEGGEPERHAYIVSKKSGNVMNVTSAGCDVPKEFCYAKLVNKNADLTKGETLVVKEADGKYACYGTGRGKNGATEYFDEIKKYDDSLMAKAKAGAFDKTVRPTETKPEAGHKDVAVNNPKKEPHTKDNHSNDKPHKNEAEPASVKQKLAAKWEFKKDHFEAADGSKVTLKGEGNGKGYHFHDLKCSLVPGKDGKFTIFYEDKKHKPEIISTSEINLKKTSHTAQLDEAINGLRKVSEANHEGAKGQDAARLAVVQSGPSLGKHV